MLPSPSCVLDRRICAFLPCRLIPRRSLAPPTPSDPCAYPLIPLSARTTIRSADVSPSRIASEKIGLAPAPQLLGPAMLQSRELVASSWHGLGRFRVNFIPSLVALLHCVPAQVHRGGADNTTRHIQFRKSNQLFPIQFRRTKLVQYVMALFECLRKLNIHRKMKEGYID